MESLRVTGSCLAGDGQIMSGGDGVVVDACNGQVRR
jgi:hypothetical protein